VNAGIGTDHIHLSSKQLQVRVDLSSHWQQSFPDIKMPIQMKVNGSLHVFPAGRAAPGNRLATRRILGCTHHC
jgi:hypothetical protein